MYIYEDMINEYVHFESLFIEIPCTGQNRLVGDIHCHPHNAVDGLCLKLPTNFIQ